MAESSEILYSRTVVPDLLGKTKFVNARLWDGVVDAKATKVYVNEDRKDIIEAYSAAGIEVVDLYRKNLLAVSEKLIIKGANRQLTEAERAAIIIPDDWESLAWTQRAGSGVSLRSLAASLSDQPVENKDDAVKVISAEVARRESLRKPAAEA